MKQKTESNTEEEDTTSLNMESNEGADAILEHRIELKINKMLQRLDEVEENLTARFNDVATRVEEMETNIASVEAKVEHNGNQVLELRVEVEQLKNKVSAQEKLIHVLEETVDDVQGRISRNTLVFNGIPDGSEVEPHGNTVKIF